MAQAGSLPGRRTIDTRQVSSRPGPGNWRLTFCATEFFMYQRILVLVDGSATSLQGLDEAICVA
jgi:hypothetical protein